MSELPGSIVVFHRSMIDEKGLVHSAIPVV